MEADWSVELGPEAAVIDPFWSGLVDLLTSPDRVTEVEEAAAFPPLAEALRKIHQQGNSLQTSSHPANDPNTDQPKAGQPEIGEPDTDLPKTSHPTQGYAFWTAKCDLWEMEDAQETLDPDEMNAEADETQTAIVCYIDLLPRSISSSASSTASSSPPTVSAPPPAATRLLFRTWRDAEQSAKAIALALRSKPLTCARADLIVRSAITAEHHGYGITAYLTACATTRSSAADTLASALALLTDTLHTLPHPHFAENPIPLQ